MIDIKNKEDCCGCTACYSICPQKCISMQEDSEGFIYPSVDRIKCIECHRCERVCPVINAKDLNSKPDAFLARTKDDELLNVCTSGGVFTSIARDYIDNNGIVYGVVYDQDYNVVHKRITQIEQIFHLPGSKFVQSEMRDILSSIRTDLESGGNVVFCGTPCQVAGLKGYLGKDYDKLLLIDLVCHGVPSPLLWKKYLSYLKEKHGEICRISFRSKYLGYHISVMEERFQNGDVRICSGRTNLMQKCYYGNISDRPICYKCPFKTISHHSDLTLFDGWHASEYVNGLKDDDRGYTVVLAQSKKGKDYICSIDKRIIMFPIEMEKAVRLDGKKINNQIIRHKDRELFYEYLVKYGIEKTVELLIPIKGVDYLIDKCKIILDRIKLLRIIKKIKM